MRTFNKISYFVHKLSSWLMWYCLFSLTIGRFIPIYFENEEFRIPYYITMLSLLVVSMILVYIKRYYRSEKRNRIYIVLSSIVISVGTSIIIGAFTFISLMAVYRDVGIVYLNKEDPKVEIVRRYIDEGAFGGGTDPDDYKTALKRPITPFLKMETTVDTTQIDKAKWVRIR